MNHILELSNISFQYAKGGKPILSNLSYAFEKGKMYAIVGKSGAGKTTLLSLLSGLASPTSGQVLLNGTDIAKIDRFRFRSHDIGVIFQSFNLLPKLTALENVLLSMEISGCKYENKEKAALDALRKVSLDEEEASRRILKLSGGQQQRVAIARALSYNPGIILADEPTGNLDMDTQNEIINIFLQLAHEEDRCVILVTHSPQVAEAADEIYRLS